MEPQELASQRLIEMTNDSSLGQTIAIEDATVKFHAVVTPEFAKLLVEDSDKQVVNDKFQHPNQ